MHKKINVGNIIFRTIHTTVCLLCGLFVLNIPILHPARLQQGLVSPPSPNQVNMVGDVCMVQHVSLCVSSSFCAMVSQDVSRLRNSEDGRQQVLSKEFTLCLERCRHGPPDLIVFNLFSLEAWLIAQHFAIPTLAVSPYLPVE